MSDPVRRRLLKLAAGTALASLLADSRATESMPLSTARDFLNERLRGFAIGSVGNKDAAFFDALAATGANLGRVFFPFHRCKNCDRFGRSPGDVSSMHRILDLARARGLKLVIAADFDGAARQDFLGNAALTDSVLENWRWFARTFGNDPAIAGLDLLNEPNPPWPNGNLLEAHDQWRRIAEQVIEAIRVERVVLPVIYEGVAGGSSAGLRGLQPLKDAQVVYSFHQYRPHEITHQRVYPEWPKTIPYPAGPEWNLGAGDRELGVTPWDRRRLEGDLRDAIAFQKHYDVPIYVGEFSCVRWAPNGSRQRYLADCLSIYRKFGWSWTYHEFRGWHGWDAEIDSEDMAVTARSANAPAMKLLCAALRNSSVPGNE